jgi:hypothetical protein
LDHLVGACEQGHVNFEVERLGGLEVKSKFWSEVEFPVPAKRDLSA